MRAAHNLNGVVPKQMRVPRRPQHRFYTESKPWEITPICIAPVVPGETLKNLLLQSRVVTSPVKSSLVGWWLEYYFFYVTHRQVANAANNVAMVLDATATLSTSAADSSQYYDGRGHNWVDQCLDVVVTEWFREKDEIGQSYTLGRGNRPLARLGIEHFADSFIDTTLISDGGALGGTQEAQDKAWELYEYLRTMKFTEMSYEDWIATYGVDLQKVEERDRPELLRYVREWSYPTNSVEPTTGVPSAALSWGMAERADKDRFFREPGFIVGYQVARPKVYLGNQTAHAASMLDRVMRWLPAIMADDPSTSLAEFTSAQGPFGKSAGGLTNGYWLDVRDLFMHGDQFLDTITDDQAAKVALPTVGGVHRYATEAMGNGLFVGATDAARCIRADGSVRLNILGTQQDYT